MEDNEAGLLQKKLLKMDCDPSGTIQSKAICEHYKNSAEEDEHEIQHLKDEVGKRLKSKKRNEELAKLAEKAGVARLKIHKVGRLVLEGFVRDQKEEGDYSANGDEIIKYVAKILKVDPNIKAPLESYRLPFSRGLVGEERQSFDNAITESAAPTAPTTNVVIGNTAPKRTSKKAILIDALPMESTQKRRSIAPPAKKRKLSLPAKTHATAKSDQEVKKSVTIPGDKETAKMQKAKRPEKEKMNDPKITAETLNCPSIPPNAITVNEKGSCGDAVNQTAKDADDCIDHFWDFVDN